MDALLHYKVPGTMGDGFFISLEATRKRTEIKAFQLAHTIKSLTWIEIPVMWNLSKKFRDFIEIPKDETNTAIFK